MGRREKRKMLFLKSGVDVFGKKIEILTLDDKIFKIGEKISENEVEEFEKKNSDKKLKVIDLNGKLLMPGVIDVHTHMREPGVDYKEDFSTGSRACAKAGITTFYDMPNTIPTTTTLKALEEKKELADKKSIVNYGFHFGGSKNDNVKEIKKVLESGKVNTVKIFIK